MVKWFFVILFNYESSLKSGRKEKCLPEKGKRSLPVRDETHKKISIESATLDRDMYLLVDDAWDAYLAAKGTGTKCEVCGKVSYFACDHVKFSNPAKVGLISANQLEIIPPSSDKAVNAFLKSLRRLSDEQRAELLPMFTDIVDFKARTPSHTGGADAKDSTRGARKRRKA